MLERQRVREEKIKAKEEAIKAKELEDQKLEKKKKIEDKNK